MQRILTNIKNPKLPRFHETVETSSLSFSQPHPFSQGVLNALSKYAPELNRGRVRSNKLTGKASGASHSQLISPVAANQE